jgi:1,2-diacylglycerol 3-alpha-glucosyltransferase
MKIAIFTNTYWPTVNGVAVSATNLREGLITLGHEVFVFAPDDKDLEKLKEQENVFRYPSFNIKEIADYELALPSLKIHEILEKNSFDIVHTEHPLWIGNWGMSYAKKTDTPIITTVHTQYDLYAKLIPLPQEILVPILQKRLNRYLNNVDLVTTPGEGSKQRLIKQGVKTPIRVVSNATDLSSYWKAKGDEVRSKLVKNKDEKLIGFVGRLSKEKDVSVLLDAMSLLLKKMSNVKLVLIGDGPDRKELEQKAKTISNQIVFLGKIDHKRIPDYYAAFDIFLSASQSEVQPMTFAEAMATGTPIVVFDVAGCNDMVKNNENGLLVDPKKGAQGLAEAATQILMSPKELKKLSAQATKWASRYDLTTATKDMVSAYEQAIHLHKNKT